MSEMNMKNHAIKSNRKIAQNPKAPREFANKWDFGGGGAEDFLEGFLKIGLISYHIHTNILFMNLSFVEF
jgi:hypothetical protein